MSDTHPLHIPDPSNSFYARLLCRRSGKTPLDNSKNTILGHKRNYSFTAIVKVSHLIKSSLISTRMIMSSIFAGDEQIIDQDVVFSQICETSHTHTRRRIS